MTTSLAESLSRAALNGTERRAIARIVELLEAELGDDLLAVWLYGSRARGEADPEETHQDRRSDIDMMAILAPGRDTEAFKRRFTPEMLGAAEAAGDTPVYYSMHLYDADRLVERRRIHSFFFEEVDRDKLVLAGGDLEGGEYR